MLKLAGRLAERHGARPGGQPRAGLALLRLRESVMLDTFYLGEIPVASARVSLAGPDGLRVEGGACVMDDSAELAAALAVLDCVLAHSLPGSEEAEQLLRRGEIELKREESIRAAMLARTRVDFSLMSAEAGNDDGA